MNSMPPMNPKQYYAGLTDAAKDLVAQEKRGSVSADVDFGVMPACAYCHENIEPPKKVMRCAACKAVLYCSKEVMIISIHVQSGHAEHL